MKRFLLKACRGKTVRILFFTLETIVFSASVNFRHNHQNFIFFSNSNFPNRQDQEHSSQGDATLTSSWNTLGVLNRGTQCTPLSTVFQGFSFTYVQYSGFWNKHAYSCVIRAGIFKEAMGARNRGGRGLSYRPARLHRLAEFIPWNQCRGPINI